MRRVKNETEAYELAIQDGLSCGISIQDGRYYVGTVEQLGRIGAIWIETPHHPHKEE